MYTPTLLYKSVVQGGPNKIGVFECCVHSDDAVNPIILVWKCTILCRCLKCENYIQYSKYLLKMQSKQSATNIESIFSIMLI